MLPPGWRLASGKVCWRRSTCSPNARAPGRTPPDRRCGRRASFFPSRSAARHFLGDGGADAIVKLAEGGIAAVAWPGQVAGHHFFDARARPGAHHGDAVAKRDGFGDVMRDEEDRPP